MGKRAVVTGANSGIGLATTLRLAADGYEVFAGARRAEGLEPSRTAAATAGATEVRPVTIDGPRGWPRVRRGPRRRPGPTDGGRASEQW